MRKNSERRRRRRRRTRERESRRMRRITGVVGRGSAEKTGALTPGGVARRGNDSFFDEDGVDTVVVGAEFGRRRRILSHDQGRQGKAA